MQSGVASFHSATRPSVSIASMTWRCRCSIPAFVAQATAALVRCPFAIVQSLRLALCALWQQSSRSPWFRRSEPNGVLTLHPGRIDFLSYCLRSTGLTNRNPPPVQPGLTDTVLLSLQTEREAPTSMKACSKHTVGPLAPRRCSAQSLGLVLRAAATRMAPRKALPRRIRRRWQLSQPGRNQIERGARAWA